MDTPETSLEELPLVDVPDFEPPALNSKLTPRAVRVMCAVLQDGNFLAVAARTANLDESTVYGWLRRGKADLEAGNRDTSFGILARCIADAESSCEKMLVAAALVGVRRDPRIALEMLGRRYKRWSSKAAVDVNERVDIVAELRTLLDRSSEDDVILIGPDRRPYLPSASANPVPALPPGAAESEN